MTIDEFFAVSTGINRILPEILLGFKAGFVIFGFSKFSKFSTVGSTFDFLIVSVRFEACICSFQFSGKIELIMVSFLGMSRSGE